MVTGKTPYIYKRWWDLRMNWTSNYSKSRKKYLVNQNKIMIYNETVNSIIEKMLYSLSVSCKLDICDLERLYFQQKKLFSSKSHLNNQLLYSANKMSNNSNGRSLTNIELEACKKNSSNKINSDNILRYILKENSILTLRIPEIEGDKINISKRHYSNIKYSVYVEIYMPKYYDK